MCEFFQLSKLLGREELKKSNKGHCSGSCGEPTCIYTGIVYICLHLQLSCLDLYQ